MVSAGQLVTASINRGIPFVMSDPEAVITQNMHDLAKLVMTPEDRDAMVPVAEAPSVEPRRRPAFSRFVPAFQTKR